ncbi:lipoprotein ABC transporter ATP-binding protein [Kosmotoga arenicorallina S304]|uniref:Lipoprotein ABC transporter ATP-binding protein n=1 Tax=Kosmotoga arenicorallina S304 TaxID=1453497 RepID=A0A176K4G3_9BACT|nr:ABC transporter ATP-binding protein [Kosmotoga arenicorallina]OAA31952.1 lipoprotein ABC transporter ATP-binding protein [Kosmotoga arenicorallina S304]
MANIIELKNIDKFYGKEIKTQVLFNINLDIQEGSFISIIGQSGSGKSTLMNIMGTLDKPTNGEVLIEGVSTNKMKKNRLAEIRNKTIGFVFQFHYLIPEFTALENILMPYYISNSKPPKEVIDRALELTNLVGIYNVKDNPANKMSGGQQQRTAIARALMNNPKIVLADEPTGNLDSDTTESVYRTLRKIHEEYNTTFVIITHDRKIAERTDRIIELRDGRIEMDVSVG